MTDIISQETNIEMRERLPDGTYKIKYPKTIPEQVQDGYIWKLLQIVNTTTDSPSIVISAPEGIEELKIICKSMYMWRATGVNGLIIKSNVFHNWNMIKGGVVTLGYGSTAGIEIDTNIASSLNLLFELVISKSNFRFACTLASAKSVVVFGSSHSATDALSNITLETNSALQVIKAGAFLEVYGR